MKAQTKRNIGYAMIIVPTVLLIGYLLYSKVSEFTSDDWIALKVIGIVVVWVCVAYHLIKSK